MERKTRGKCEIKATIICYSNRTRCPRASRNKKQKSESRRNLGTLFVTYLCTVCLVPSPIYIYIQRVAVIELSTRNAGRTIFDFFVKETQKR